MTRHSGLVWCQNIVTANAGPLNIAISTAIASARQLVRGCWVVTSTARVAMASTWLSWTTAKPILCPWQDLPKESHP